jgi:hypothetical protein
MSAAGVGRFPSQGPIEAMKDVDAEGCGQLIFRVQTKMYKLQCRLKAGLYGRHAGQRRE